MSRPCNRRLFIFNMSQSKNEYFLSNRGEIQKDFSPECCFTDYKVAMALIQKIEAENPQFNFQLDIIPYSIPLTKIENDTFWEMFHEREIFKNIWHENKSQTKPYVNVSVSTDFLEKLVSSFWVNNKELVNAKIR